MQQKGWSSLMDQLSKDLPVVMLETVMMSECAQLSLEFCVAFDSVTIHLDISNVI